MRYKKNLRIIYLLGIILAISAAIPAYLQSNFIEKAVGLQWVAIFFVIANLITTIAMIFYPRWISLHNNFRVSLMILATNFLAMIFLSLAQLPLYICIFFVAFSASASLIWINMDIFLEKFTSNTHTGKIRTTYFTLLNAGWILSPFVASLIVRSDNYSLAFQIAALMLLPFILILIGKRKLVNRPVQYEHGRVWQTCQKIWKNKNLRGIFTLAFFLQLFYNSAVVFVPLYLHRNLGFDWGTLGIIFSIMLVPFILIEIPAGILADKKWGEKELMATGFAIIITALLLFFFVDIANPILWGAMLFLSRVGAALVEAMRETYFFKIVNAKDVDFINFFRLTGPVGYLVGSAIGALVIWLWPVQYIFLVIAIILMSSFYFLWSIKDTK